VSIKNKLVTAVTTAGLLAGLFGSAFVPAARAAVGDAASVTVANKTFDEGTTGTSTAPLGEASGALATTGATFDIVVKDGTGTALAAAQALTFTASSGFLVSAADGACAAVGTPTTATATVSGFGTAGAGCVTVKSTGVTIKAQTGTITITHGVTGVIKTVYVWAIGDVASVTLSILLGRSGNIAAGNTALDDYMGINAKDATGNRITVAADGTGYTLTTGTADLAAGAVVNKLDLTAGVCTAVSASGSTVAAQVTHTATGVLSNSVTLTCTTAGVRVTGVELQDADGNVVTSGPRVALSLYANFVDASGRPVGDGGAAIDTIGADGTMGAANDAADYSYSPIEVQDNGTARGGAAAVVVTGFTTDAVASYGQVKLGVFTPSSNFFGKNTVRVAITSVDLTLTIAATASFTASYTTADFASGGSSVTVGIVAGAKLKKATITLSAAAGKLVTVTIEKVSTGRTFTYYRKANASGVATFIIRRTGTWEVFASYGDDVTDTVTLKR
jgi:hypothetical protein